MTTTTLRLVEPTESPALGAERQGRYNLRATLPDRPGALGAVAAALGRTGADIVSISVVERDCYDAVDDITFDLPAAVVIDDVYAALHSVNGIWIESLHPEVCTSGLARATALLASVAATSAETMPLTLVDGVAEVLAAGWAAIWPASGTRPPVAATADAPTEAPCGLTGMRTPTSAAGGRLWETTAPMPGLEVGVVPFSEAFALGAGRPYGPPFRPAELEILEHIARVSAALFAVRR